MRILFNFLKISLGPFAAKVQEQQAQTMVDTLSDNLLNQKEDDLRDISSSCLKAIITEIPAESINTIRLIVKRVTPKLLRAIVSNNFRISPPKF